MGPKNIKNVIDTAKNGLEALTLVKLAHIQNDNAYCYGLILMDLSMPIMDGYEATERIRDFLKRKNLPQPMIVALTGHTHEDFIVKAWRY